jgi:hypothetical protein
MSLGLRIVKLYQPLDANRNLCKRLPAILLISGPTFVELPNGIVVHRDEVIRCWSGPLVLNDETRLFHRYRFILAV